MAEHQILTLVGLGVLLVAELVMFYFIRKAEKAEIKNKE